MGARPNTARRLTHMMSCKVHSGSLHPKPSHAPAPDKLGNPKSSTPHGTAVSLPFLCTPNRCGPGMSHRVPSSAPRKVESLLAWHAGDKSSFAPQSSSLPARRPPTTPQRNEIDPAHYSLTAAAACMGVRVVRRVMMSELYVPTAVLVAMAGPHAAIRYRKRVVAGPPALAGSRSRSGMQICTDPPEWALCVITAAPSPPLSACCVRGRANPTRTDPWRSEVGV
jgi:hypothetical protein